VLPHRLGEGGLVDYIISDPQRPRQGSVSP